MFSLLPLGLSLLRARISFRVTSSNCESPGSSAINFLAKAFHQNRSADSLPEISRCRRATDGSDTSTGELLPALLLQRRHGQLGLDTVCSCYFQLASDRPLSP